MLTTEPALSLIILALVVAPIHATLQLGVSILTLLSGHSLGRKKAHATLLRLSLAFSIGTFVAVFAMALFFLYVLQQLLGGVHTDTLWVVTSMIAVITGGAIVLVYYRNKKGTLLWVPRELADYLTRRTKGTTNSYEAATLGAVSALAELPFALAPLLIFGMVVRESSTGIQLTALLGYALIVTLPLLIITGMISSGHRLSTIQRWRETNKSFLQSSAGFGLILIALYLTLLHLAGEAV